MQNPCGHTDAEFAQFTKTERRVLRMAAMEMPRADMLAALEIEDSTLRVHLAHIRQKQAQMRRKRAEEATKAADEKLAAHYVPESPVPAPTEGKRELVRLKPFARKETPPAPPPPIERPVSVPPPVPRAASAFVELSGGNRAGKSSRAFGGFR